jgi:hypothetical protein
MARPRFFESLDILPAASQVELQEMATAGLDPNLELSVCAMGPVEKGDEILAMRVWVWQEAGTQVAASAGNAGVHLGGHEREPSENFPLKGTDSNMWMIQTQLEPHSPQFVNGKPALATGMALVERDTGVEVEHWSQAVMIEPHAEQHRHPPSSPTT